MPLLLRRSPTAAAANSYAARLACVQPLAAAAAWTTSMTPPAPQATAPATARALPRAAATPAEAASSAVAAAMVSLAAQPSCSRGCRVAVGRSGWPGGRVFECERSRGDCSLLHVLLVSAIEVWLASPGSLAAPAGNGHGSGNGNGTSAVGRFAVGGCPAPPAVPARWLCSAWSLRLPVQPGLLLPRLQMSPPSPTQPPTLRPRSVLSSRQCQCHGVRRKHRGAATGGRQPAAARPPPPPPHPPRPPPPPCLCCGRGRQRGSGGGAPSAIRGGCGTCARSSCRQRRSASASRGPAAAAAGYWQGAVARAGSGPACSSSPVPVASAAAANAF